MAIKTNTGGQKDYVYSKDDYERIESEDTESTREFKKALREWRLNMNKDVHYETPRTKQSHDEFHRFTKSLTGRHKKRSQRRRRLSDKKIIEIVGVIIVIVALAGILYLLIGPKNESKIEEKIFELVNKERAENGVGPLLLDKSLNNLAKDHSEYMISSGEFEHSNNNVGENIVDSTVHYWVWGCGLSLTDNQIAKCMFKSWKGSEGHYANMINPSYTHTGVGVKCKWGKCKGTQNFS